MRTNVFCSRFATGFTCGTLKQNSVQAGNTTHIRCIWMFGSVRTLVLARARLTGTSSRAIYRRPRCHHYHHLLPSSSTMPSSCSINGQTSKSASPQAQPEAGLPQSSYHGLQTDSEAMSGDALSMQQEILDVNTALVTAAGLGDTDAVTALLTSGASFEHADKEGKTALLHAASGGHTDAVTTLLTAGAGVDHADKKRMTALLHATCDGHTDTVNALIAAGASLEASSDVGWPPLVYAAYRGHADVFTALLDAGADIEHGGNAGRTALVNAAGGGYMDILAALLTAGARVDHGTDSAATPLQYAAFNGKTRAVVALLSAGANVHHRNSEGTTALMVAAGVGHANVVTTLLEAGASIEQRDDKGHAALVHAARNGHDDALAALLSVAARRSANGDARRSADDDDAGRAYDARRSADDDDVRRAYDVAVRQARQITLNDGFRKAAGDLLSYRYFNELPDDCYCGDVESMASRVNDVTSPGQVSSVRTLTDVWELEAIGRLRHPEECAQIRLAVLELIERVCEEVSATAPDFACKPVLVGSTANGTKAGLPDEYDFMFELEKFTGNVLIEETEKPGVVRVKDCNEFKHLSVNLKEQFVKILCQAVAKVMKSAHIPLKFSRTSRVVEWNKVCTQFNFVYVAGKAYNNLPLSVDITPSIHVSGKPAGATDRFPADYHYHVVPKHVVGSDEYWLICSAKAESLLITEFPPVFRQALIIAKALLDPRTQDYEEKILNVANNEKLKKSVYVYGLRANGIDVIRLFIATRSKPKSVIGSYFLKLALLHVHSTISPDDSSSPEKLPEIVRQLFMFIEACQTKGELKHPLIPSIDVFAEDKGKLIERVPAGYLRMKAVKAVLARLDDGPLVSNSGLLQLSAEEVWQQMQHSLYIDINHSWFLNGWNQLCDAYDRANVTYHQDG
ncbi:PREDICTED: uncharacterized protein LOC106808076 [Priapulus caudatus]|uniref:Uncharacterized protein LOC106808076 n=1 Tax=Priapulus caudatus TaxID=37621 RepID=A0ABM1E1Q2_PRICU|nr:PREDICTED: uncharacterized protein LOC106808076 [Priapulus caudatus]